MCVCVSQKEQKNWGRGKKRRGGEKLKKLKNHLRVLRERPPDVPAHGVVRVISGRERRRYQPVVLPRFCVLGGEGPVASVDGVEDALRERLRLFRLLRLFRPLVRRLCRGVPAALLPQPRRGRGRVKVAGALDHLPGVSRRRLVFHGERGSGSGSDGARRRGRRRCDVLFFHPPQELPLGPLLPLLAFFPLFFFYFLIFLSIEIGSSRRALLSLGAAPCSFSSPSPSLSAFLLGALAGRGGPPRDDGAEQRVVLEDRDPHPRAELLLVVLEELGADLVRFFYSLFPPSR